MTAPRLLTTRRQLAEADSYGTGDDTFDIEEVYLPRESAFPSQRFTTSSEAWAEADRGVSTVNWGSRESAMTTWEEYEQEHGFDVDYSEERSIEGSSFSSGFQDEPSKVKNELREFEERRGEDLVTSFGMPTWLSLVLVAVGISHFSYNLERERERRRDAFFLNPFPDTHKFVTSLRFEVVVAVAIVLSCTLLGWQVSVPEGTLDAFFSATEHVFVLFFLVEWGLRVLAFGWVWVFEFFNFCDTVLVLGSGVLLKWFMEPLGVNVTVLRICTVLRVLRLAHFVKAVRFAPFFRDLWSLTRGLVISVRPLLWTLSIAIVMLYVFALAATELIAKQRMFEHDDHVQSRLGNILRSLLTMLQIMTLDNWGSDIVRPAMEKDGSLVIFFIAVIGISVFVFWNLVTAIIVRNTYLSTLADSAHLELEHESEIKKDMQLLKKVFHDLDEDGSGDLSEEEFMGAIENREVMSVLEALDLSERDLQDVWDVLDEGEGLLSVAEFISGIRRMQGQAKAKDVVASCKSLQDTQLGAAELRAQVMQFGSSIEGLENDIARMEQETGEIVGLFQEVYHRLQDHIDRTAQSDQRALRQRDKAARKAELLALAESEDATTEKDDTVQADDNG